jgi:D-alanyl-D-alanine carboxypeptidase
MAATASLDPALVARLEAALDEGFAASKLPGVTVGLWIPGQGEWVATRGVSDTATDTPMSRENQAPVGSVTKTVTATIVLQLIGEGTAGLTLDSTLDRWYPDFPDASTITVRMLLNHSSGIAEGPSAEQWVDLCSDPQRVWWTPDEQVAIAASQPRSSAPGVGFSYSNYGYIILGRILEKVTGTDYATLVRSRILEPAGMSRSRIVPDGALAAPFSHGYTNFCAALGPAADTFDWNLSWSWAAGAMASTIDDLHRWGLALGEGRGLTPALLDARQRDLARPSDGSFPSWLGYGLGVFVETDPATNCVVSLAHGGDVPGYQAQVTAYPTSGAVFALMDNSLGDVAGGDAVNGRGAIQLVLEPVYRSLVVTPTAPCDVAPSTTTSTTPTVVGVVPEPVVAIVATPNFPG